MAKRRSNHDGSIKQLKSGSWRAWVTVDGRRLSKTFKLKRECEDWRKKVSREIDDGMTYASTLVTLGAFLSDWLASSKHRLRPRTMNQYEQLSRQYILPHLAKIKIRELRPERIQKVYDGLLAEGVGIFTVLKIHAILSASLEHALKLGVIPRNPAKLTMPPKKPVTEMKFLDESQVCQLLVASQESQLGYLLQLVLATGLRQMELLGLKWTDLDWVKRSLKIERQLAREKNGKDQFVSPKSRAGRRTLIIGEKTVDVLRKHYEQQLIKRKTAGESWEESGLIFTNHSGGPLNYRNLTRDFKKLLKSAGLPDIRFHDLRHTTATLLLNKNVNLLAVSNRLGHSRTSITTDTYGHLLQKIQEDAADTIDELITPIPVSQDIAVPVGIEILRKQA